MISLKLCLRDAGFLAFQVHSGIERKKELDALNRRHLKLNEAEQAAILHKLQMRDTASATAPRTQPE